jgi:hypothetical protein
MADEDGATKTLDKGAGDEVRAAPPFVFTFVCGLFTFDKAD